MANPEVPGYLESNNDFLHDGETSLSRVSGTITSHRHIDGHTDGCWAETEDDGLSFVKIEKITQDMKVIYSFFDMQTFPGTEYREVMNADDFMREFSHDPDGSLVSEIKWVWHDKSPFPWEKLIKLSGPINKTVFAADQLSAAARVAESLQSRGKPVDETRFENRGLVKTLKEKLGATFSRMKRR